MSLFAMITVAATILAVAYVLYRWVLLACSPALVYSYAAITLAIALLNMLIGTIQYMA